jgi:hypothetical protein
MMASSTETVESTNLLLEQACGQTMFSNVDWVVLGSLILTSSVVAAALTHGLGIWKETWDRHRQGKFSTLYVCLELERYAADSASLVGDQKTYESSRGAAGEEASGVVPLTEFRGDIDWGALGIKATTDVLQFRVEVDSVRAMLSDLWQHIGEEIHREAAEYAVDLGLTAIDLAESLRKSRKLDRDRPRATGEVHSYLRSQKFEVDAARKSRAGDGLGLDD